jgi:hypothetical protein
MIYTDESLDRFLEEFAAGTFPKASWNHGAHVTVAACYLQMYPQPEAARRIRAGIRHYNECQGTANTADSGYHETLTLFWIAHVTHLLAQCGQELSRAAISAAAGRGAGAAPRFIPRLLQFRCGAFSAGPQPVGAAGPEAAALPYRACNDA